MDPVGGQITAEVAELLGDGGASLQVPGPAQKGDHGSDLASGVDARRLRSGRHLVHVGMPRLDEQRRSQGVGKGAVKAGCLASAADLADEVVVVDTGSKDRTKEIALQFGARVYDFSWVDSFAAARDESLRRATGDWAFWLDADDRLDDDNRERLRRLFAGLAGEPAAAVAQPAPVDEGGRQQQPNRLAQRPRQVRHRRVHRHHQVEAGDQRRRVQKTRRGSPQLVPEVRDRETAGQRRHLLAAELLLQGDQAHAGHRGQGGEPPQRHGAVAVPLVVRIALPADPHPETPGAVQAAPPFLDEGGVGAEIRDGGRDRGQGRAQQMRQAHQGGVDVERRPRRPLGDELIDALKGRKEREQDAGALQHDAAELGSSRRARS